ncbi:MAG: hypothetical protein AAF790_04845 [Planctomycetota bacterium]
MRLFARVRLSRVRPAQAVAACLVTLLAAELAVAQRESSFGSRKSGKLKIQDAPDVENTVWDYRGKLKRGEINGKVPSDADAPTPTGRFRLAGEKIYIVPVDPDEQAEGDADNAAAAGSGIPEERPMGKSAGGLVASPAGSGKKGSGKKGSGETGAGAEEADASESEESDNTEDAKPVGTYKFGSRGRIILTFKDKSEGGLVGVVSLKKSTDSDEQAAGQQGEVYVGDFREKENKKTVRTWSWTVTKVE